MTSEVSVDVPKSKIKDDAKDGADQYVAQVQKKLTEAFDVFDGDKTKAVDVKEIPTIIYSLNLVPSSGELQDLISEMEEEDNSDVIRYEKYMAVMTDVIMNRRYKPANENYIYRALQVLDADNKGYITKDELVKLMTTEGEILSPDEINEMLQTCLAFADPESPSDNPHILYKYYVSELVVEDNKD